MRGILFIITSPSGGGKGTLIREVLRTESNLSYSVSFTTRNARTGEENGKHYFFVSREEFEKLIEASEFLESASVHGNFYGTSRSQVERELSAGHDIILEIDVQGAEIVKKLVPEAVGIFILPPSYEVLKERLVSRQTETDEALQIRLSNARTEVGRHTAFDYTVVNDRVERAADNLKSIISAERLRTDRQGAVVQDILDTFTDSLGGPGKS